MWKHGFQPKSVDWGYVPGFSRQFYQHSTDHRGTPESPGRVVTLIETSDTACFGVVLEIPPDPALMARLDYREKDGYERRHLTTEDGVEVITYLAPPDNPGFLGAASLIEMAEQIASSRGPSGKNSDYLFELEAVLRHHGVDEPHIFELAQTVRGLL